MDIGPLTVSGHNNVAAGDSMTLKCSAAIIVKSDSPYPKFEWFFGPDNSTLSSGVTVSNVMNNSNTYTSTLQISPLPVSDVGIYTCRLGGNQRLAASITINAYGSGKSCYIYWCSYS